MSILTEKKDDILYIDFNAPPVNVLDSEKIREIINILDNERETKVAALMGTGIVASIVQGGAFGGGCEIALCSDLLIAEKGVEFSQPEIKIGVFPPAACAVYPIIFPSKVMNYLMYSGAGIKAEELENLGVVNKTFPGDSLYEEAHAFLKKIARLSFPVLKCTKKSSNVDLPLLKERMAKVNRIYLDELMKTEDALEGLNSFLEKRRPVWKNK
jgi:enoyl-CoA hydratase/carnithine racemase